MLGEFENKLIYRGIELPNYKRFRQFYFSLDIDFSKVQTNSKFLKRVFNIISYIKVPMPTIELSNKKFKGHYLFF